MLASPKVLHILQTLAACAFSKGAGVQLEPEGVAKQCRAPLAGPHIELSVWMCGNSLPSLTFQFIFSSHYGLAVLVHVHLYCCTAAVHTAPKLNASFTQIVYTLLTSQKIQTSDVT